MCVTCSPARSCNSRFAPTTPPKGKSEKHVYHAWYKVHVYIRLGYPSAMSSLAHRSSRSQPRRPRHESGRTLHLARRRSRRRLIVHGTRCQRLLGRLQTQRHVLCRRANVVRRLRCVCHDASAVRYKKGTERELFAERLKWGLIETEGCSQHFSLNPKPSHFSSRLPATRK